MVKNKVIHARIDDNTYDNLLEKCNEIGCSVTDFIQSVITDSLENEEPSGIESEPIPEIRPEPMKNLNVEYGKVYDQDDNLVGTIGNNS